MSAVRLLRLFLALCLVGPAAARRPPRPAPCADGRFSLRDQPVGASGVPETLVLRDGTIAVEPTCPAVAARIRPTKRATVVRAVWSDCPGVAGRVRLKARLRAPA